MGTEVDKLVDALKGNERTSFAAYVKATTTFQGETSTANLQRDWS